MSYDPRRGSSNYLGMDMETSDLSGARSATRRTTEPTTAAGRRASRPAATADDMDKTMVSAPSTQRRASTPPRRGVAPAATSDAYARRPVPAPRPVASPRQQAFDAPHGSQAGQAVRERLSDPLASAESFFLRVLAIVLRVIAICLAVLVVASAFLNGSARGTLLEALRLTPLVVPPALLGRFVYETPFGGVVRGDLALASIILFCADYICMRVSTSLRNRRERGA